jgi:hypothetical protein
LKIINQFSTGCTSLSTFLASCCFIRQ